MHTSATPINASERFFHLHLRGLEKLSKGFVDILANFVLVHVMIQQSVSGEENFRSGCVYLTVHVPNIKSEAKGSSHGHDCVARDSSKVLTLFSSVPNFGC